MTAHFHQDRRYDNPPTCDADFMCEDVENVLRSLKLGLVGNIYIWEPKAPRAFARVKVIDVTWNGDEFVVHTESPPSKARHSNDLSRFLEAVAHECHCEDSDA